MSLYTKKGDNGRTSLATGERINKDDRKAQLIGAIDELNVVIGITRAHLVDIPHSYEINQLLFNIQQILFTLGSNIAGANLPFPESLVENLEKMIDYYEQKLPPLHNFIIPGGSKAAAFCHLARTQCRSAERHMVALHHVNKLNPTQLKFINRLSDALFVLARKINLLEGYADQIWLHQG
ncbi:cob(I)yrinic acid a,c-diamide adenosyltransferase [candidate division WWE3 bacterium]|nr:cob(I)yrinic acid a,c-diamide adenosyltransferase [candidate division WWE3 bacterium]